MSNVRDIIGGSLAAAAVYVIFGANNVFCKDITDSGALSPFMLFFVRTAFATLVFWIVSLFTEQEKVQGKDLLIIFVASIFGLTLQQISSMYALVYSTPYDVALIGTLKPVVIFLLSAVLAVDRFSFRRFAGCILSFTGALLMVTFSGDGRLGTTPLGFLLIMVNVVCFAIYIIFFKKFINGYKIVTYVKWLFLFSFLATLPFAISDKSLFALPAAGAQLWGELAFSLVFATALSYFLMPFAQKRLRPTYYGLFVYLQPVTAGIMGVIWNMEEFVPIKIAASILIVSGVCVVSVNELRGKY